MSAPQKLQLETLKPRIESVNTNTDMARRMLQITPALKQLVQSGYSGPLIASNAGRMVLQTLGEMGMNTKGFENMRASDVLTGEMLGPMVHQLSKAGSQLSLKVVQGLKPGSENSAGVRMAIIEAMEHDSRNIVNYGNEFNKYLSANPMDFGLTGFKPPEPEPLPGMKRVKELPPPKDVPLNTIARDPVTGQELINNGNKWVPH